MAGEYISVSSQVDTEQADIARERIELATQGDSELRELAAIYLGRGLAPDLALQVAEQLAAHDALAAHTRDELGYSTTLRARPLQAAAASALSFAVGAAVPLLVATLTPERTVVAVVAVSAPLALAGLGAGAAWSGGAPMLRGSARVTLWGAAAMAATALVGAMCGVSV